MKGSRPIADMDWLGEAVEDTGHLLLVLHPPNILVLWDTYSGKQIWKKVYANETALFSFDFDPFDVSRLAFKSTDCILFINDFNPSKCPVSSGKKLYVSGPITSSRPPSQSPNRNSIIESNATGMCRSLGFALLYHCVPTGSKWIKMVPKNLIWIFMLSLIVLKHRRRNFYRVLLAKSA